MRKNKFIFVPSLFTILNMFSGFLAILNAMNGAFIQSAWFIIIAAIFDSLDGTMARLTKSATEFGVELDSLADVISFGVAPSVLVYKFYFHELGEIGLFLSSLLMIFGALRLARFNVELVGFDKEFFKGLPIPSSASTVASYIILFYDSETGMSKFEKLTLIPMVIALSLLMVSSIKYETIPKFSLRSMKSSPIKFFYFYLGIILGILTRGKIIFPWFVIFILSGAIRSLINTFKPILGFAGTTPSDETEDFQDFDI
ncbi:CDP-diacylglycerol---serine O-phosphatidyltransferase [Candidatus Kryptonium thompsonii]|uniref:CDP-diacylglycerol--serine O-phosphatidyltransferase n=1 Tax=Candidatus Kryptonium thompsonii TaxID=1633631 RepID=UPI000707D17D|nr:CDP-diacylglycerol--serine O-phosphatidyltransferase [Candidatus Kryptonium thompsoni]CUS77332.1 CDP-diacylglycerol---serine O-phosphatidyltransferase [Candidatus Kryptonium thompsoni]CUT00306.1 CDP-diacylglycerol---serine O-phosphatidyltransferase [Candidatus Kryptonium thompsoni]CUT07377.1 CDP-diacylglycerol---serine O-phosphatidyltransferase [Candidatus Kryptonium thompsoni]